MPFTSRSRWPTRVAPWLVLLVLLNALASSAFSASVIFLQDIPDNAFMQAGGVLALVGLFAFQFLPAERARARRDPWWSFTWAFPVALVLVSMGLVFLRWRTSGTAPSEWTLQLATAVAVQGFLTSAWLSFALWLTVRAWGVPARAWLRGVLVAFPLVDALVRFTTHAAPLAGGGLGSPIARDALFTPLQLLVVVPVLFLVHAALGAPNPRYTRGMIGLATAGVLAAVAAAAWAWGTGNAFASGFGPTFPGALAVASRTLLTLAPVPGVIALVLAPHPQPAPAPEPAAVHV